MWDSTKTGSRFATANWLTSAHMGDRMARFVLSVARGALSVHPLGVMDLEE